MFQSRCSLLHKLSNGGSQSYRVCNTGNKRYNRGVVTIFTVFDLLIFWVRRVPYLKLELRVLRSIFQDCLVHKLRVEGAGISIGHIQEVVEIILVSEHIDVIKLIA